MSVVPAMLSFNFEGTQLRGFEDAGESWFVAQDACAMLGIINSRDALSKLDEDEKGVVTTDTLGGFQQLGIVSESGLYVLIFRSRKPDAKRIRKWVTQEVLPTIRKTGRYELAVNDDDQVLPPVRQDALGLEGPDDVERLRVKIALIREARHAYGPKSARGLWEAIGLPDVQRIEMPSGQFSLDDIDSEVRDWLTARCTIEGGCRTESMALYNDYRHWCGERDLMPLGHVGFAKQLSRMNIRSIKSNRTWRIGIRLKD